MLGGQFEVDATRFLVRRFVLDAKIGYRNLAAYNAESMPLGDFRAGLAGIPLLFRPGQVAVEILLQLRV